MVLNHRNQVSIIIIIISHFPSLTVIINHSDDDCTVQRFDFPLNCSSILMIHLQLMEGKIKLLQPLITRTWDLGIFTKKIISRFAANTDMNPTPSPAWLRAATAGTIPIYSMPCDPVLNNIGPIPIPEIKPS